MNFKNTVILAIVCTLLAVPASLGDGFKQVRLSADRGEYSPSVDPWLTDSIVVTGDPQFTMEIFYNYDGNSKNHPDQVDGVHLILTTNLNPVTSGLLVTLANMRYNDAFGSTGIPDKTITATEWTQFSDTSSGLTIYGYNTAPHGILTNPNWYAVVRLDDLDSQYLKKDGSNKILVDITASATDSNTRLHIDSVGTYYVNSEDGFVGNPYSSDLTWLAIPEFPTIALPVIAVLGILFIMQRRKKEE